MALFENIFDLRKNLKNRNILLLGKGPSLTNDFYVKYTYEFSKISINESAIYFPSEFAFFIDVEPFDRSIDAILKNKSALIIPYYFNVRISDTKSIASNENSLSYIKRKFPYLLESNIDIYFFDTGLGDRNHSKYVFKPNFVSVSSLLEILFVLGFDNVFGIGFDGGNNYSKSFKSSETTTQVKTFNNQFVVFKGLEFRYKKKFINMNKLNINIYVGTTEAQKIPTKVLEYSILKHSNENINVIPLDIATDKFGLKVVGGTPFSLQRFFIPKLNDFKGVAIYLDSDMLVFDDIKSLYLSHTTSKVLCSCPAPPNSNRRDQFSVFTVDCSLANWDIENIITKANQNYKDVMFDMSFEPNKAKTIDWHWNSLEYYDKNVKLIHFTDMDKQPWISKTNPNRQIWNFYLREAINSGFISMEEVTLAVQNGYLRKGIIDDIFQTRNIFRFFNDLFYLPQHTLERFPFFNKPLLRRLLAVIIKVKRIINNKYDK